MHQLKIGYLTSKNPHDRAMWSGLIHYMYNALNTHAGHVEHVGAPLPLYIRLLWHWVSFTRRLLGHRLEIMHSIPLSLIYGRYYSKKLSEADYDVIFAPIAETELAYLKTSVPIFYFSDTTFAAQENYYYPASQLSPLIRWQGNHLQHRTIQRSDVLLYASKWASQSAIRDYAANPDKIHIAPFGANLDTVPAREALGIGSTDGKCRLLFVSADWKRKGGQLAYDALLALRNLGVDAQLTVVGCTPSPPLQHPHLHVIPFLSKKNPAERTQLENLFFNADFFLLPTRAECSGLVFCEASAFGVPSITTDTGGVSTPVQEGVNGFLHPLDAGGDAYAATIAQVWSDPARYQQLRRNCRDRYDAALNWKVWAESVRNLMQDAVAETQAQQSQEHPFANTLT
jgi:glycosyltransferase involved in cell wall biosynthesis